MTPPGQKRNDLSFTAVIWLLFMIVAAITISHHELWRDEIQAWSIARNSNTLTDLYHHTRYEGHPLLWFVLLWIAGKCSSVPETIQYIQLVIASMMAFTWLRWSPFTRLQRVLFVFGYFPFYEYGVFSRNYGIGILLLLLFCTAATRWKKPVVAAVLLALAMQTNLYALIIAGAVSGGYLLNWITSRNRSRTNLSSSIAIVSIVLAGMFLSVACIYPPHDQWFGEWRHGFSLLDVEAVFTIPWKGYVPIPRVGMHFWNTNMARGLWIPIALSIGITCYFCSVFRNRRILFIFISAIAVMMAFAYLRMFGVVRHHGHIYILLVICLWLYNAHQAEGAPEHFSSLAVTVLFALNAFAGMIACFYEFRYPFSRAKDASVYIRQHQLDTLPLAGDPDYVSAAVAGYMDKTVYFPYTETSGKYTIWNVDRSRVTAPSIILERVKAYGRTQHKDVLLMLNYEVKGDSAVQLLQSFPDCIEGSDVYFLHLVSSK